MNHRHSWELIPWYVNGSITEVQRGSLLRHLDECADCRDEVEAQRVLMQTMRTRPLVENMPHGSLQKLWSRIDAHPAPARAAPPEARRQRLVAWLAAAVVLQTLLTGVLTTYLLRNPVGGGSDAPYRTVSSSIAAPGAPSIRAVFSPAMTLGEFQALLERSRLRIVNGPTQDGVYSLATGAAGDDPKQALLALRAHPAVKFAELVGP
jgi:Putative zinc-finger